MRIITTVCLFLVLTGCVIIQSGQQQAQSDLQTTYNYVEPFHIAMEQLLQNNNTAGMKSFIKEYPDSLFIKDAEQLLKLQSNAVKCRRQTKTCDTQLNSSHQELQKLKEDIDRLTQLNLEMDRSSP